MSGSKGSDIQTPDGLRDPGRAFQATEDLLGLGQRLTSDSILTDSVLGETVQTNPEITQLAMEAFRNQRLSEFEFGQQDLANQIERAGGTTSSTLGSSLTRSFTDFENQISAIGGQASIADINRALENRIRLTGLGGEAIGAAGNLDLRATEVANAKKQLDFQNRLEIEALNEAKRKDGFSGALQGGMGGAALALGLAPFTGGASLGLLAGGAGLGALAGGLGPKGTGASLFEAGGGVAGISSAVGSLGVKPTGSRTFFGMDSPDALTTFKKRGLTPTLTTTAR